MEQIPINPFDLLKDDGKIMTPLQNLISHFTFNAGNYSSREEILVKLKSLLEKEKQMVIDACNAGLSGIPRSADQYYNQTYKTQP